MSGHFIICIGFFLFLPYYVMSKTRRNFAIVCAINEVFYSTLCNKNLTHNNTR